MAEPGQAQGVELKYTTGRPSLSPGTFWAAMAKQIVLRCLPVVGGFGWATAVVAQPASVRQAPLQHGQYSWCTTLMAAMLGSAKALHSWSTLKY